MRSCVIGRGVETFSISSAMALASYTPTQMGSTVLLPTSLRMTIGMLVTGSIMSPRIFISTSMDLLPLPKLITSQPRRSHRRGSSGLTWLREHRDNGLREGLLRFQDE